MVVELRGATEDFSADVQFDLSGPPVPDLTLFSCGQLVNPHIW